MYRGFGRAYLDWIFCSTFQMLQKYKLACQRPINHLNCLNIPQSLGLDISRGRPVNTCTYGEARSIPYHPEVVHSLSSRSCSSGNFVKSQAFLTTWNKIDVPLFKRVFGCLFAYLLFKIWTYVFKYNLTDVHSEYLRLWLEK